ncbi:hypothetical protein SPRG_13037 [Saprolegnia parasitica CBS 223.65]|uniref:Uncharacterized protein n=1 Tax=Saprolegnia parasitica (strain CBS 223.65) TaxID=695850 RepID=A0A067BT92_SAPPC|nr:hypothetical protein SPRG_13037 [Saprolegnia parasitica CBS 223.65]KDO21699.1 hypothetical protein SPRG_13037 [Saprolegnia parasitica CBS 223.65]|eukprot:XP_012207620.1 hypothetical protein SPRG_13037 [Saprolegnia parasitica CBS 223.65]
MRATDEAGPSKLAKRPPATLFAPQIIEAIARCILCPYTLLLYLRAQPARALSPSLCSLVALAATTPSAHLWPRLVIASTNDDDTCHYVALLPLVPSMALLQRIAPSSVLGRAIVAQSPKLHVANLATLDHVANAVDAYTTQIVGLELKSTRALPRTTTRPDLGACLATCTHLQSLTLRVPLESLSLVASALASKHGTLRSLHLTLFEPRARRIPHIDAVSAEASIATAFNQIPSVHVGIDGLVALPAPLRAALRDVASIDSVHLGRSVASTTTILDGAPLPAHWRSLWLDDMELNAVQATTVASTLEDAALSRLVLCGFAPLPLLLPALPTLLQLRALEIEAMAIPDAIARDVASAIGHLTLLSELVVRQAELSDAGLSALTSAFSRDEGCGRYLTRLVLGSNTLTSLSPVVSALPKLPALRYLDVQDNQIGAVHMASLEAALCAHPTLHVLDISRNGLGTDGAVTLLMGAATKPRLHVNASDNGIDVDAIYAAHRELKKHRDRLVLEATALWNVPKPFEYSRMP